MGREAMDDPASWSLPAGAHRDDGPPAPAAPAPLPPRISINEALRKNWLEIWYQPKIDLKRKCLAGAEALARIRHPQYGLVLPGDFLPADEDHGIVELTEHALLATLHNWSIFDQAGFNLQLAINLPVTTLVDLPIARLVQEHRPKAEHWPGLILEVTEDQVVRDLALSQKIADQLKISGITISIDDFGAGYSSFSSLRELAFAELKVHQSFVKNCAADATNAAICQTAIDLAHRFGSKAVAEGIESAADLHALQLMNCDFGQGVLIAPPMPMDRFLDLLRQRLNRPVAPKPKMTVYMPDSPGGTAGVGQVA